MPAAASLHLGLRNGLPTDRSPVIGPCVAADCGRLWALSAAVLGSRAWWRPPANVAVHGFAIGALPLAIHASRPGPTELNLSCHGAVLVAPFLGPISLLFDPSGAQGVTA